VSGADWLSYSLQDFVMFGPQVFLRLFIRINQDLWPWQVLAVLVSVAVPVLLLKQTASARRLALGLVAVAWITSGYGFLVGYFGPINWPAGWFGWAFVVQGCVLAVASLAGGVSHQQQAGGALAVIWLLAVFGLPWAAVAEAGDWRALALFGVAPGTTVGAGVLALALLSGPWRWLYLFVPVLWTLFSVAMLWGLRTWWLLPVPLATLVFTCAAFWLSPRPGQNPG